MLICRVQVVCQCYVPKVASLIRVFKEDGLEGQNHTQEQSTLHKMAFQNRF